MGYDYTNDIVFVDVDVDVDVNVHDTAVDGCYLLGAGS